MSLIYDYLKIHGRSGSEREADVEIPPTLKRRDSEKPGVQSFLLILGSCLVGTLFVFLIIKIFTSSHDVQVASLSDSVPQARQQEQPGAVPAPLEAAAAPEPVSAEEIQVFPEPEKPLTIEPRAMAQAAAGDAGYSSGTARQKMTQPLELVSSGRKVTFPENSPIYVEPAPPAVENAEGAPHSKFYSASRPGAAETDKSRKYYQAGLQAQRKGDGRIAESYYRKALEDDPHHMDAMINLSALYVQQERYGEAEELLAQILAVEPDNSKGLVNMGVVNLYQGYESKAEAKFKAALVANPREENALVNLAYLAEKNRDFAATEMYYRQLLQVSPDNVEVLLAYGHLLEEQGRYSEAMTLYGDCLALGSVKKDPQLSSKISGWMRLLAGVVKK